MPAVSKAQQRFFGMVRSAQKGEMETPSSEVAKAAASMSKSDVKKFAKTKHKGLPNKKEVKEGLFSRKPKPSGPTKVVYGGESAKKKAEYEKRVKQALPKRAFDTFGRELDPRSGKLKEALRSSILTDRRAMKKIDDNDKKNKEQDARMKYGKNFKQFTKDAESAKNRLRPGEVKRYDKEKGKWVSNKD